MPAATAAGLPVANRPRPNEVVVAAAPDLAIMYRVNVEAVARRYIALSNAVDYDAIADLFALDADWIPISPIESRKGREAIRRGYLEHVKRTNRPIINDRYYSDGNTCVVEFEVDLGDGDVAGVVDVFTVNDDGEIARLAVYRR